MVIGYNIFQCSVENGNAEDPIDLEVAGWGVLVSRVYDPMLKSTFPSPHLPLDIQGLAFIFLG